MLAPKEQPSFAVKIVALWTVFLLGTLFHTQLALMPLFHGLSVLAPHGHVATDIGEISAILWLMLAFFVVPLIAITSTCLIDSRWYRIGHFWVTVIYSVLNLAHLVVDLTIPPVAWYQVALMAFLFLIGLLLNLVAYQWIKESHGHGHRLQSAH
ncbi:MULTISPECIES: hypothetical protein [Cyanophyceae]|uniref:Uncharacterized protein n=1 Tax=Leptolyngbya subtilissima DQ-A4 TaxID=2933933 RepID=A0ABV0KAP4_9CYAN|nr:hypothetical protein [Nodosilinea sp. FACHB-141]MBD2111778.1 hypothetical protein [Nodosilinea sp. FACHB-141]